MGSIDLGVLEPLHWLLDNDVMRSKIQEKAFQKAKHILSKTSVFEVYDVNQDVALNCDAFEYGIGCVLTRIVEGKEKPIAYESRTMNKT